VKGEFSFMALRPIRLLF